jgi:hypothetical protein
MGLKKELKMIKLLHSNTPIKYTLWANIESQQDLPNDPYKYIHERSMGKISFEVIKVNRIFG